MSITFSRFGYRIEMLKEVPHFLTCFLALLLYKYLEKKVNMGGNRFTPNEITSTLADMNFKTEKLKIIFIFVPNLNVSSGQGEIPYRR